MQAARVFSFTPYASRRRLLLFRYAVSMPFLFAASYAYADARGAAIEPQRCLLLPHMLAAPARGARSARRYAAARGYICRFLS